MNYNPSPKTEFLTSNENIDAHHVVVQNPAVRKGLEVALAQMQRQVADNAPLEMGACAAAHLRCLGAHDLIATFYNLAEVATPAAKSDNVNLPGNVRPLNQPKK